MFQISRKSSWKIPAEKFFFSNTESSRLPSQIYFKVFLSVLLEISEHSSHRRWKIGYNFIKKDKFSSPTSTS